MFLYVTHLILTYEWFKDKIKRQHIFTNIILYFYTSSLVLKELLAKNVAYISMMCSVLTFFWEGKLDMRRTKQELAGLKKKNYLQYLNAIYLKIKRVQQKPDTRPERCSKPFSWCIWCSLKSHQKWFQWKDGFQEASLRKGRKCCGMPNQRRTGMKISAVGLLEWWIQIWKFWFKPWSVYTEEVKRGQQWVSTPICKRRWRVCHCFGLHLTQ